jgi:mono/diheme cytochrome c family protein
MGWHEPAAAATLRQRTRPPKGLAALAQERDAPEQDMGVLKAAQTSAIVAAVGFGSVSVLGAPRVPAAVGPFTVEQARAGQAAYRRYCERCHGPALAGLRDAPPIVGADFIDRWRRRTTRELFQYIQRTMPPESSGDAGYQVDLDIVAFILQANGAKAGRAPLTITTEIAIGTVAPSNK